MRVTREQFDLLVRSVEERFANRPSDLRLRIAALAALGYAGLLAGVLGALLLAALFLGAMFYVDLEGKILLGLVGTLILAAGAWGTLRVLLVRIPPPEGHEVSRAETPALHALLDELRAALRSAPFHHVLLTGACNAAVIHVPRLGVFGWPRQYLLLGLPLMEQLSPEEFRAVLAHEFAHLSREHGRFSHWVYRLRLSWEKIFEQMSRPPAQSGFSFRPLILKFVDWFWPRFNAHAFVLSRLDEYEADGIAARVTDAQHIASSLQRIVLHHRHLSEGFWPEVWKAANTEPQPPSGVFTRLRQVLSAGPSPEDRARWMDQEFRIATTNVDTHPCLTDRLRALDRLPGNSTRTPWTAPIPSAADTLLGSASDSIRTAIELQWRKECESNWRERHARAAALNHRLATIDQASGISSADVDKLWDRARVLMELHDNEQAQPLLRDVLALRPGHPAANFHLGRTLLEKDDPGCELFLERAAVEDAEFLPHSCRLLHDYFRRLGRTDKVREIAARLDRHDQQIAASHAERSSVSASDPLIPHGLSPDELATLREALSSEPGLSLAELARKDLKHFPDQKLFLLCVHARRRWHGLPDTDAEQALASRLSKHVHLPGRVLVFAPQGSFRRLARKLRTVENVTVHRAS